MYKVYKDHKCLTSTRSMRRAYESYIKHAADYIWCTKSKMTRTRYVIYHAVKHSW